MMGFRVEDETDADRIEAEKRRAAERLNGIEAIPIFSGFMMAGIAAGHSTKVATQRAEECMAELRKRYT